MKITRACPWLTAACAALALHAGAAWAKGGITALGDTVLWRGAAPAPEGTAFEARFVGPVRWTRVDADSNGEADQLRVDGTVEILAARGVKGDLSIEGWLQKGVRFITFQPGVYYAAMYEFRGLGRLGAGRHPFAFTFGGEDIRRTGLDGPYQAHLALHLLQLRRLDTLVVSSPPYPSTDFGELPYRLLGASEQAVDTNGDGLFDGIEVSARLLSPSKTRAEVDVWAAADSLGLEGGQGREEIPRGESVVKVMIEGTQIHRLRKDGPYDLDVSVLGTLGAQTSRELRTRPYRWTQFAPPDLELRDSLAHAYGADDPDGRGFRTLVVEVPVTVRRAGGFSYHADLQTGQTKLGSFVAIESLATGPRLLRFHFDGGAIADSGKNGPFTLTGLSCWNHTYVAMLVSASVRTREALDSRRFMPTIHPLVALTGTCSFSPRDTNGDGRFDVLRFRAGVAATTRSRVQVQAFLESPTKVLVQDLLRVIDVEPDAHEVVLDFDGGRIFARGEDGRYVVSMLDLVPLGSHGADLERGARCDSGYATPRLSAASFRRAATIRGRVTRGGRPVWGACVYLHEDTIHNKAYSDTTGVYRLMVPGKGARTCRVGFGLARGEPNVGWRALVDGKSREIGFAAGTGDIAPPLELTVRDDRAITLDFVHPGADTSGTERSGAR